MLNPSILGSFMDLQTPKMFLWSYFIQKTFRNFKTNFCLKHCLYNHNFHEILAYFYYELQYVNLQYLEKLFGQKGFKYQFILVGLIQKFPICKKSILLITSWSISFDSNSMELCLQIIQAHCVKSVKKINLMILMHLMLYLTVFRKTHVIVL